MDGCWRYPNPRPDGYARVYWEGSHVYVHRAVYEVMVGAIPEGYQIDHLCFERSCYNPAHLEAVTPLENIRRMPRNLPKLTPHGTINGYNNYKCRCQPCRDAWNIYWKERRKR